MKTAPRVILIAALLVLSVSVGIAGVGRIFVVFGSFPESG